VKGIVARALLAGALSAAAGASAEPLDLDAAIELARARSPELAGYRQSVAAAHAGRLGAIGAFLPALSASAGYSRIPSQSFSVMGQTFSSPSENYTLGASASLPLFAGFRNVAGLAQSDASRSAAGAALDRAQQSVALVAARDFIDALKAQALLGVARTDVQRSEQQLERVQALLEVGSVPPVDVFRQRGELGADRLAELDARDALENARNTLNITLGLPVQDRRLLAPIEVESIGSQSATLPDLVDRALRTRADLRAARDDVRAAEAGRRISLAGYSPSLDLNASYNWNGADPPGGIDDLRAGDSYSVGLSLAVPLFDRLATPASVQRAAAEVVYRRAQVQSLERAIAREVAGTRLALANAAERVSLSGANLAAAEEELRLAEERYSVGAGTLLERNVAAASWSAAETHRITALYDLLFARIALAAAAAEPIASWASAAEQDGEG